MVISRLVATPSVTSSWRSTLAQRWSTSRPRRALGVMRILSMLKVEASNGRTVSIRFLISICSSVRYDVPGSPG